MFTPTARTIKPFPQTKAFAWGAFVLLLSFNISAAPASLKIAYANVESFPYFLQRTHQVPSNPGVSVEIIQMVCDELNIKAQLQRLPGKRVLRQIGTHAIDGAFLFSFKKERSKLGIYPLLDSQPNSFYKMDTISYFFYKLKNNPAAWKQGQLENTDSVGVNLGYAVISDLNKMNVNIQEVRSSVELVKILLNNRVPIVAAQEYPFERNWGAHKGEIEKLYPPIRTKDYFFIFSRQFAHNNPKFVQEFWKKIREVSQREYPRLIEKYLNL